MKYSTVLSSILTTHISLSGGVVWVVWQPVLHGCVVKIRLPQTRDARGTLGTQLAAHTSSYW